LTSHLWVRRLFLVQLSALMPWLDHDHFLPSAIQRYHQLFLPALQLIDAILATLGPGHSFAVNQVGDGFFLAARIEMLS
jgi:hypothetical protein